MTTLAVSLVLAAFAGLALGALYFWTLLLSTAALTRSRHPALLLAVTGVGRMAALLTGLWLLGAGDWRRVVAALVGVVVARTVVVRHARHESAGAKEERV